MGTNHRKSSELQYDPQLNLEFVDRIGVNDRNAGFERNDELVRHVSTDRRVEGEKKPTSLTGDRIAAINTNVIAGVEGDKPVVWEADERDLKLNLFVTQCARRRQGCDLGQRMGQLFYCLDK
jgi:hypothetical protein